MFIEVTEVLYDVDDSGNVDRKRLIRRDEISSIGDGYTHGSDKTEAFIILKSGNPFFHILVRESYDELYDEFMGAKGNVPLFNTGN